MPRILLLLALCAPGLVAAESTAYFLDGSQEAFDPSVPTPESVIGHEVGEYHVTHDHLLQYFEALAAASPRVRLERTGETHEGRPTFLLLIASEANMAQVDDLRQSHLDDIAQLRTPAADAPLFLWFGYSVHGNEASGANAALVVAYRLAASDAPEVRSVLDHSVILMEPSINPDGLQRFAAWVNANRSASPSADPYDREHAEPWPSGRGNHYWFDINRDWLLLQHPESRARIAEFQRWRPHVLTDHHEMGSDGTFFFQPGVPDRRHPLTPEANVTLTAAIAEAHAATFDAAGQSYYSEESFDDFYYGKGSTYPDANGSIGILFEQASARGHQRESEHGTFSFAYAIRNHVRTSFSTLRGALANQRALLDYPIAFYRDLPSEGPAAYLFEDVEGSGRGRELVDLLSQHQIQVEELREPARADGVEHAAGMTWIVRTAQPQGRLVRAVMEERDEFPDHVFYDVSSWTLPHAYGLRRAELDAGQLRRLQLGAPTAAVAQAGPAVGAYAYLLDWRAEMAPAALQRLQAAGVRVAVATAGLGAAQAQPPGTLVVRMGEQTMSAERVLDRLQEAAVMGVPVTALASGAGPGPDLGSPSIRMLTPPRALLVTGPGVSSYEAGEVWHLLDARLGIPVTRVEQDRFARVDLRRYTHLLLVDGSYSGLTDSADALRAWVEAGGVIVAQKDAIDWLVAEELLPAAADVPAAEMPARRPYAERDDDAAVDLIGGAILQVDVDTTHPLAFGIQRPQIAVFRDHSRVRPLLDDAYANVAVYSEQPYLSGYVSATNVDAIAGSLAVGTVARGRGRIVLLADDGQFRSFWRGTERFLLDALFMAAVID